MKDKITELVGSRVNYWKSKDGKPVSVKHHIIKAKQASLHLEQSEEFNQLCDLIERCLHIDPEKRIKPSDALKHGFFTKVHMYSLEQSLSLQNLEEKTERSQMNFNLCDINERLQVKTKIQDKRNRNYF